VGIHKERNREFVGMCICDGLGSSCRVLKHPSHACHDRTNTRVASRGRTRGLNKKSGEERERERGRIYLSLHFRLSWRGMSCSRQEGMGSRCAVQKKAGLWEFGFGQSPAGV